MSKSHIVVLTVVISLAIYNIIQAAVIRNVNIPELDVNQIVGKWYRLTSDSSMAMYDGLTCTTYDIQRQSEDEFIFTKIETLTPETKKILPDVTDHHTEAVNCRIIRNPNMITMTMGYEKMLMVIFDAEYNSYMATYLTDDRESISSGNNGVVSIFSREKTLPESVIDKIKKSNFYQQGVSDGHKASIRISNITDCP